MKDNIRKFITSPWVLAIALLLVIRSFILYLALRGIPYLDIPSNIWMIGYGGDTFDYFNSAKALLHWNFVPGAFPIGFSFFLAPFVWILNAQSPSDILMPIVILQSIFFYTFVSVLVYILAKQFLIKRLKALIITFIFLIYPYVFYLFFNFFAQNSSVIDGFKMTRFAQLMFFFVLSDPLSTILMLGSLLVMLKIYKKNNIYLATFLGFVVSWAFITRFQNAIMAPVYVIIFYIYKKFKNLSYFIIGFIPPALFQLYANFRSNGSIFAITYGEQWENYFGGPAISIRYPLKLLEYSLEYSPLLFIPIIIIAALLVLGIINVIKHHKDKGFILIGYFLSILIFISFLAPTFFNPRYFLPIIPPMLIVMYLGVEQVFIWMKEYLGESIKLLLRQVLKYGLVTLISYIFLIFGTYILVEYIGFSQQLSYFITISLAYIGNYIANTMFVFRVDFHNKTMIKYIIYLIIFWLLNNMFFNIFISVFTLHYLVAIILNLAVFGLIKFIIQRKFIFNASI